MKNIFNLNESEKSRIRGLHYDEYANRKFGMWEQTNTGDTTTGDTESKQPVNEQSGDLEKRVTALEDLWKTLPERIETLVRTVKQQFPLKEQHLQRPVWHVDEKNDLMSKVDDIHRILTTPSKPWNK